MRSSCALHPLPHAPLSVLPAGGQVILDLVAELVYASYRANRGYAPKITPAQWERVYGAQAVVLEQRYQHERQSRVIPLDKAVAP